MLDDLYPDSGFDAGAARGRRAALSLSGGARAMLAVDIRTRTSNDALTAFTAELRTLQFAGLMTECWRRRLRRGAHVESPRPASLQSCRYRDLRSGRCNG